MAEECAAIDAYSVEMRGRAEEMERAWAPGSSPSALSVAQAAEAPRSSAAAIMSAAKAPVRASRFSRERKTFPFPSPWRAARRVP